MATCPLPAPPRTVDPPSSPSDRDTHHPMTAHPSLPAPVLVVMLKAPRPGLVKTRLARELDAASAVAIYRRLVEHQLRAVPETWRVEIHFSPADAANEMNAWLGPKPTYFPQAGEDLGARLIAATVGAFARGAYGVVVIGGDCPALDGATLQLAASGLQQTDVVLGPAADGGYYLIGLRCSQPHLFAEVPWSTAGVFAATTARVRAAALSLTTLELKEDVDDLASWLRQEPLLGLPRISAPTTAHG